MFFMKIQTATKTTRNIIIILLFSLFKNISVSAQDIFDAAHSVAYAEYLYKTGQFTESAAEYERVVFFRPDSFSYKVKLISAYRKSRQSEKAFNRIENIFGTNKKLYPCPISQNYISILFEKEDTSRISNCFSEKLNLEPNRETEFRFGLSMLENHWQKAENEIKKLPQDNVKTSEMKSILLSAQNTKLKNKTLAVGLSAIIPGMGKVYSKNYTDGLIVFTIVSVNAWQAYRGFRKEGKTSVYGWIFGSVSAGFYLGNLYGAAKSVKKYNRRKIEEIHEEVLNILLSDK